MSDSNVNSLVTVCIPTHNNGTDLESTIESLLRQTYKPILIKIFDNASKDNTIEIAQSIVDENPGFVELECQETYIDPGQHMTSVINSGVSDYTALFAPGITYDSSIIEEQAKLFQIYSDLGAVVTHGQKIDPTGLPIERMRLPIELQNSTSKLLRYEELFGLVCQHGHFLLSQSLFVRSSVLRDDIVSWNFASFKNAANLDLILRISKVTQLAFLNSPLSHFQYPKTGLAKDNLSGRTTREDLILVVEDHLEKLTDRGMQKETDIQNFKFLIFRDQVFRTRNAIIAKDFAAIPRWSPWQWSILKAIRRSRWHFRTIVAGWMWYFTKIFFVPLMKSNPSQAPNTDDQPIHVYVATSAAGSIGRQLEYILTSYLDKPKAVALVTSLELADDRFKKFLKKNKKLNRRTINIGLKEKLRIFEFKKIWNIYSFFKTRNVTLIHGIGAKGGSIARFIAWMIERPSFYSPMGGALSPKDKGIQLRSYINIEKMFAPITKGLIFESKYMEKKYLQYIGNPKAKTTICTPFALKPIPEFEVKPQTQTTEPWILGYFSQDKVNFDDYKLFILAIHKLVDADIEVDVRIHNEGNHKKELEKLIGQLNLNDRVVLLGASTDDSDSMKACHTIVFTSEKSCFDHCLLEALSFGIPVIAPSESAHSEWLTDEVNGLLFTPQDATSLSQSIIRLKNDTELAQSIATNAAASLNESFANTNFVASIQQFYQSSINS